MGYYHNIYCTHESIPTSIFMLLSLKDLLVIKKRGVACAGSGRRAGRKEGRKEGWREGRREGRKEGRREDNKFLHSFNHC